MKQVTSKFVGDIWTVLSYGPPLFQVPGQYITLTALHKTGRTSLVRTALI